MPPGTAQAEATVAASFSVHTAKFHVASLESSMRLGAPALSPTLPRHTVPRDHPRAVQPSPPPASRSMTNEAYR